MLLLIGFYFCVIIYFMKIKVFALGLLEANCYVVSENKDAVIIDPGHSENAVNDYILENNLSVHGVILTHAHFDHIMGADFFAKAHNAPVYIHQADSGALIDFYANMSLPFLHQPVTVESEKVCLEDGQTLNFGDLKATFVHTPGHTVGGMCIEVEDSLFTGDTLFEGSAGRTDFPGGSERVLLDSLQKLKELYGHRNIEVYPGHGPKTDIKTEIMTNYFFRRV